MASTTSPQLSISKGSSEENIKYTLQHDLPSWTLTSTGSGIQRRFKFKTFKAAWSFMDRVAQECKTARHHPEWANVYNEVFIRWTTHEPKGLSEQDTKMALFCDEHARELGVVEAEGGACQVGGDGGIEGLADGLAKEAGDCCVPKKK